MKPIDNYFNDVPESLQRTNLIKKGIPQRILTEQRVDSMDYKPAEKRYAIKSNIKNRFQQSDVPA
jgi:hypothetical protein